MLSSALLPPANQALPDIGIEDHSQTIVEFVPLATEDDMRQAEAEHRRHGYICPHGRTSLCLLVARANAGFGVSTASAPDPLKDPYAIGWLEGELGKTYPFKMD